MSKNTAVERMYRRLQRRWEELPDTSDKKECKADYVMSFEQYLAHKSRQQLSREGSLACDPKETDTRTAQLSDAVASGYVSYKGDGRYEKAPSVPDWVPKGGADHGVN